ncbi:translocase Tim22/17-like protein [Tubulinosema ratisbonensis]|uniref:Translocase Tim22/17-like protein n=1 Tax=Tubulinosema ratisbonensis TaxID=291195 RepID=A0A437AHN1_9MICR|nr:translocase Tim22/17-like protein [Tubulinosema ratisbonensis]
MKSDSQNEKGIKPIIKKALISSAQGYLFGCVVGSFTQKKDPSFKSILLDAHKTGITFAKVGCIYGLTEGYLNSIKVKPINSVYSSALAGLISQSNKGKSAALTASGVFAFYNAVFQL